MKLENQVCSLQQAKRLKELGIGQESICLWLDYSNNYHGPKLVWYDAIHFETDRSYIYAAFTVAELGVMLAPIRQNPPGGSEAEARAAFLIRRLETGKSTAEECNQRLLNS